MTVRELLREATVLLQRAGSESPRLDATLLLAESMNWSRERLLASYPEPVSSEHRQLFDSRVAMRCRGVPIAYILGRKEFYGLELEVGPAVLIPRPDSELIVEIALELAAGFGPGARMHDCCTGSGCIAIAVAYHAPDAVLSASDQSAAALAVAERNAGRLVPGRVHFHRSDYLAEVPGAFHLITANPPYLTADEIETLATGEPREALYGGDDGLQAYRRLIPEAVDKLSSNGYLVIEAGGNQHERIASLMTAAGFNSIMQHRDLGGNTRVTVAGKG